MSEDWRQKRAWLIDQAYDRLPHYDNPDRWAAWREGINAVLAVIEASDIGMTGGKQKGDGPSLPTWIVVEMAVGLADLAELVGLPRDTDTPAAIVRAAKHEVQYRDDLIAELRKQLKSHIRTVDQQQAEINRLKAERRRMLDAAQATISRVDVPAEVTREELHEFLSYAGGAPDWEAQELHEHFVIYRRKGGAE